VAIWVTEPIGLAKPRRIASTPAMNVVVTAPMPGINTPSFPCAGLTGTFSLLGKYLSPLSLGSLRLRREGLAAVTGAGRLTAQRRTCRCGTKCYNTNSMRERATATLTTVIADDEQLACDELAYLLREFPEVEVVATGRNGLEAVQLIQKTEPDLVFLDVHMPGQDGVGVVRELRESGVNLPHFIFVTAYDQYAVEAFRLEAMDYLLKPVDRTRLAETLERARRAVQEKQKNAAPAPGVPGRLTPHRTKLLIRNANRNFIVDAQDVIYATIDNGLITLVATNVEGHSNYRTIEDLQANLDKETFWRVHRSYLVNIHKIKEVVPWFKSSYQLRMDDKKHTEIPVSRVQTKRLRELLKL
jgi:two-component system LytT family response regulator/two-component system response regulator LytT